MKIYLAGSLFTLAERLFNEKLAELLRARGYGIWLPQAEEPREFSTGAIFTMDVNGIDHSDAILACMDGPDPDSGTAWECGYAYAKGKMVVTYRTDFRQASENGCDYNIMLWEGGDVRVKVPCLKFKTIEEVAEALDVILKASHHHSLTPEQKATAL